MNATDDLSDVEWQTSCGTFLCLQYTFRNDEDVPMETTHNIEV